MKPCIKCGQTFEPTKQAQTICDNCHAKYKFVHQKIKCLVCGKSFVTLYRHLHMHGMSKKDYIIKFPGQPLQSETLATSIIEGVPEMPKNNFCTKCGTMFEPHASITLCVSCYEKKITTEREIECMICHRRFNEINAPHLSKMHNMSIQEYKAKFPNAPTSTPQVFKNRIDGYEKKRNADSLINRRKDQLTRLGIKFEMQGETIVYGKYEEMVTSMWFAKTDSIISHFLSVRKRGGIPVITAEKDYKTYCATLGIYDHFKVLDIIYRIRYLPIIKEYLKFEKNEGKV